MLDNLTRMSQALDLWSNMEWDEPHNQMHVSRPVSLLVQKVFSLKWHTLPFEDTPGAPSLSSVLKGLAPKDSPMVGVTPVPFHGMAESLTQPHPISTTMGSPPPALTRP